MSIHLSSATRLVTHAGLSFESVQDPRRRQGLRHPLRGLLSLMVLGFATARRTPRAAEGLCEDLGPKRLRRIGLSRPISDTRLHNVTAQLKEDGFREELYRQVQRAMARGDIRNDLLPYGSLSIDGKGAGSGMGTAPNAEARQSVCDAEGTACWDVFALRAVLTSSLAHPCLDQMIINGKSGEATIFPALLDAVARQFDAAFRYVGSDAGLTSVSNACKVRSLGKHYYFAVKGNQPRLHQLAVDGLEDVAHVAHSFERAQGKTVERFLSCIKMPQGDVEFPDATELWRVDCVRSASAHQADAETRYFVVSIPPGELTPEQKLLLVRRHWVIENNSNWTADVVLGEDTRCPVNSGNGTVIVSWLNLLALNLLSILRANLTRKDKQPLAWRRVQDKIYQALFSEEDRTDTTAFPA